MKTGTIYTSMMYVISYGRSPSLIMGGILLHLCFSSVPAYASINYSLIPRGLLPAVQKTEEENKKQPKGKNGKKSTQKKDTDSADEFDEFEEEASGFMFTLNGFIELENFINTYTKQEPEDINKKNEIRLKLNMQLGTDRYYFKCVPNFYVLPFFFSEGLYDDYQYAEKDFTFSRNGRMAGRYYELSFNECYVNVGFDKFRLRLGNQLYAWGTADTFNPTSYINPTDSRELFLKDPDEIKLGVFSLSGMIFISDFSIEIVFVPFHVGALSAISGNFWSYHYNIGFLSIIEDEYKALPPKAENLGAGIRAAGSVKGVDFSVSMYYGPDNNPILRPISYIKDSSDVLIRQEYHTSINMGADISFKLWKFEIHAELAYSPNKYGVVDEKAEDYSISEIGDILPYDIRRSHFISYALGFNFTHKDLIFMAEWFQSCYTDPDLMRAYLSDLLTMSLSYSFLEDKITISMTAVCDVENVGYLLGPVFEVDFQNGFSMKAGYSYIGESEKKGANIFTLFDQNDIFILEGRYAF